MPVNEINACRWISDADDNESQGTLTFVGKLKEGKRAADEYGQVWSTTDVGFSGQHKHYYKPICLFASLSLQSLISFRFFNALKARHIV